MNEQMIVGIVLITAGILFLVVGEILLQIWKKKLKKI